MAEARKIFNVSYRDITKMFQQKPGSLWIMLGLIGLGLVLLFNGNDNKNSTNINTREILKLERNQDYSAVATRRQLESELTEILSTIDGVGRVKVELNIKTGNRKVWERKTNISKRATQEQGVVNTEESNNDELVIARDQDGRDAPVLKEELAPEIQGVIVVASGARDVRIRKILISTVMTVLDLPAHRVMVIAGSNGEDETDEQYLFNNPAQ